MHAGDCLIGGRNAGLAGVLAMHVVDNLQAAI